MKPIVCPAAAVPPDPDAAADSGRASAARVSAGWRALRVDGSLDLSLVGVLAALVAPLAEAGVSVFPIATHDTDWILVPGARVADACRALETAGHAVRAG